MGHDWKKTQLGGGFPPPLKNTSPNGNLPLNMADNDQNKLKPPARTKIQERIRNNRCRYCNWQVICGNNYFGSSDPSLSTSGHLYDYRTHSFALVWGMIFSNSKSDLFGQFWGNFTIQKTTKLPCWESSVGGVV